MSDWKIMMKQKIFKYFPGTDTVSKEIIKEDDVITEEIIRDRDGQITKFVSCHPDGKLTQKTFENGKLHGYRCVEEYDEGLLVFSSSYNEGKLGWKKRCCNPNYIDKRRKGVRIEADVIDGKITSYNETTDGILTCSLRLDDIGKDVYLVDHVTDIISDSELVIEDDKIVRKSRQGTDPVQKVISMLNSLTKVIEYGNTHVYKKPDGSFVTIDPVKMKIR